MTDNDGSRPPRAVCYLPHEPGGPIPIGYVDDVLAATGETRPTMGWACGHCGQIYKVLDSSDAHESASRCCDQRCSRCGHPKKSALLDFCDLCAKRVASVREAEAFMKAQKVRLEAYAGTGLYIAGLGRDGFFRVDDLGMIFLELAWRGIPQPAYAWACTEKRAVFDVRDRIVQRIGRAASSLDEDAILSAQALIDAALQNVVTYEKRKDLVVLLLRPGQRK